MEGPRTLFERLHMLLPVAVMKNCQTEWDVAGQTGRSVRRLYKIHRRLCGLLRSMLHSFFFSRIKIITKIMDINEVQFLEKNLPRELLTLAGERAKPIAPHIPVVTDKQPPVNPEAVQLLFQAWKQKCPVVSRVVKQEHVSDQVANLSTPILDTIGRLLF